MNEDLSFNDTSKGFSRRVKVIPFNNEFTGASCDANIECRLLSPDVLQVIAYRAMVAFKEKLHCNDLTLPSVVDVATKKYLAENDPIGEFVKWYMSNDYHLTYMLATEFYDKFKSWCVSNCLSGLNITDNLFRKGIRNHKFTFDVGVDTEDIYVYTPDYAEGVVINPAIPWHDCAYCSHCGNSMECTGCIKKDLLDTYRDIPALLQKFWDELPADVKSKYDVPKSGFVFEGLEDLE